MFFSPHSSKDCSCSQQQDQGAEGWDSEREDASPVPWQHPTGKDNFTGKRVYNRVRSWFKWHKSVIYCRAENFHWTKFLPNPASYLCVAEIFSGINFRPCGKSHHRLYVFINMGQKICGIKISPMRAGGEKGKKFSSGENFWLYSILWSKV